MAKNPTILTVTLKQPCTAGFKRRWHILLMLGLIIIHQHSLIKLEADFAFSPKKPPLECKYAMQISRLYNDPVNLKSFQVTANS